MTCWRRLRNWNEAGIWHKLHQTLLDQIGAADLIDWSRASMDAQTIPAVGAEKGGPENRPKSNGSRKTGIEGSPCGRATGRTVGCSLTAANCNETTMLETLLDAIEPIRRPRGRSRKRPEKLHADKAYQSRANRRTLRRRHVKARIARRGIESSERLGRHRWVVERTLAWLSQMRRLKIRYERRADIHEALLQLDCALITWRYIQKFC